MRDFRCPADVSELAANGSNSFCIKLELYADELNISMVNQELNISNSTPTDPGYGFTLNMSCCPNNPVLQGIFLSEEGAYDPNREGDDWRGGVKPGCIVGIPGITDTSSIAGVCVRVCVCVCACVCVCVHVKVWSICVEQTVAGVFALQVVSDPALSSFPF